MTNPSGDRDTISLLGFRGGGGGKIAFHPLFRLGRMIVFPDPTPPPPPESFESNSSICHHLDQSLFV